MMITKNLPHYELLDSGHGRKLEIICGIKLNRPSPGAIWKPRLDEKHWQEATSVVIRTKGGGGRWEHKKNPPSPLTFPFEIKGKDLTFLLKFTSFGHCGVFFEQIPIWEKLFDEIITLKEKLKRPPRVINLFGYTGCASLVMALAGAEVFHVDSSKGVLDWGQESQKLSRISQERIKWAQADALGFLRHSLRKNFTYDGILADPPSWGHGVKKEVWDFQKDIHQLVEMMMEILDKKNSFLFLSSHTHGVQAKALENLIRDKRWKTLQSCDLGVLHQHDERILPAGILATASTN